MHFETADQFGYKPKHSTEFCVFVVKQVTDYFKSNGSSAWTFLNWIDEG